SSVASGSGAIGPAIGATLATAAGYPSVFLATGAILAASGFGIAMFVRRPKMGPSSSSSA
ncbi:MAG TPA: hypothetical protein VFL04_00140, partial [Rectinemataceae bacterium]|nr:hypothetical protein [Rectinemataceae bacterium]